jgi:hypothetical protein
MRCSLILVTVIAIAGSTGCTTPESPSTSLETPTVAASPVTSSAEIATNAPEEAEKTIDADYIYGKAMDAAWSAATIAQSAVGVQDWLTVGRQWQRAIALLQSLPPSYGQKEQAEQKIAEYQRNLTYAEQKAGRKIPPLTTTLVSPSALEATPPPKPKPSPSQQAQAAPQRQHFFVMAGGGSPQSNEIALEKNVFYFQRTLEAMGYRLADASLYFANGNDNQASIRYIDPSTRQERFKVPEIPDLDGASTIENFRQGMQKVIQQKRATFFYFTGHGAKNDNNVDNNAMILWNNGRVSVQEFSQSLDRLPQNVPFVAMMAQCYAGSFANMIYEGGNPNHKVALQTRCGFFATVKTQTSVGCTPEVNEADYRDYSSSFFAGLSGITRTGDRATSADYNRDGKVSYAEAHAFAKIDNQSTDLPVSTSEVWLQKQTGETQRQAIWNQPIADVLKSARPEQSYVVRSLAQQLGLNLQQAYATLSTPGDNSVQQAYWMRLGMELINIAKEKQIREQGNRDTIAILNRLLDCEDDFWQ